MVYGVYTSYLTCFLLMLGSVLTNGLPNACVVFSYLRHFKTVALQYLWLTHNVTWLPFTSGPLTPQHFRCRGLEALKSQ